MTEKRYNSLVRHHTKYKLTFFFYKSDHIDKAIQVHVHVLRVEAWDALHFLPIYNFHRSDNSINITWQILYLFQYIVFMKEELVTFISFECEEAWNIGIYMPDSRVNCSTKALITTYQEAWEKQSSPILQSLLEKQ